MEVILSLQAKAVWHVLEALVCVLGSLVARKLPHLETGAKETCRMVIGWNPSDQPQD
jgi:hypothetical protein